MAQRGRSDRRSKQKSVTDMCSEWCDNFPAPTHGETNACAVLGRALISASFPPRDIASQVRKAALSTDTSQRPVQQFGQNTGSKRSNGWLLLVCRICVRADHAIMASCTPCKVGDVRQHSTIISLVTAVNSGCYQCQWWPYRPEAMRNATSLAICFTWKSGATLIRALPSFRRVQSNNWSPVN